MQSKLQTLSGLRFTPTEIPPLRRLSTGYTKRFSSNRRGCWVWRGTIDIKAALAARPHIPLTQRHRGAEAQRKGKSIIDTAGEHCGDRVPLFPRPLCVSAPPRLCVKSSDAISRATLDFPQFRKLIERHRRQFTIIPLEDQDIAIDLVVEVAVVVQRVAAAVLGDDRAESLGVPVAETHLHL